MRVFTALDIGDEVRNGLQLVRGVFRDVDAAIKWVAPDNLHITLVFVGDIAEDAVEPIARCMDAAVKDIAPVDCSVSGLGVFGNRRAPRVIWAGLKGALPALEPVRKRLVSGMAAFGLSVDSGPFAPHITIGRVKSCRNPGDLYDAVGKAEDRQFGSITLDRIILFESRLMRSGPVYAGLHESRFCECP